VLRYILPHCPANNVDFKVVLPRPMESSFCERGRKARMAQSFRNFGMTQYQDIPAQAVFKIGDFSVPLYFETAGRHFLLHTRLTTKNFPHGR